MKLKIWWGMHLRKQEFENVSLCSVFTDPVMQLHFQFISSTVEVKIATKEASQTKGRQILPVPKETLNSIAISGSQSLSDSLVQMIRVNQKVTVTLPYLVAPSFKITPWQIITPLSVLHTVVNIGSFLSSLELYILQRSKENRIDHLTLINGFPFVQLKKKFFAFIVIKLLAMANCLQVPELILLL